MSNISFVWRLSTGVFLLNVVGRITVYVRRIRDFPWTSPVMTKRTTNLQSLQEEAIFAHNGGIPYSYSTKIVRDYELKRSIVYCSASCDLALVRKSVPPWPPTHGLSLSNWIALWLQLCQRVVMSTLLNVQSTIRDQKFCICLLCAKLYVYFGVQCCRAKLAYALLCCKFFCWAAWQNYDSNLNQNCWNIIGLIFSVSSKNVSLLYTYRLLEIQCFAGKCVTADYISFSLWFLETAFT